MNPFHSCRSGSDSAPCGCRPRSVRAGVPCVLLHILWPFLFVTSGSAVIDYEIQRRAFGRHTSPLARYLTTIDFLGPCLRCRIKSALSSPWYKALLTTVSLFSLVPSSLIFPLFVLSPLAALSSLWPRPSSFLSTVAPICALPRLYVLCIKSSLSLTPAVDRSEGRETRCNAIFSFVFTGGIFYHEDEFLRRDGSQGKYHHGVLFLANGVPWRETPLCLCRQNGRPSTGQTQRPTNSSFFFFFFKLQTLDRKLKSFMHGAYLIKSRNIKSW